MELASNFYPIRAFIKYKAKEQLRVEFDTYRTSEPLDEALFDEIANTLFSAARNRELYQECRSREKSGEIENRIADELAQTYKQIKLRQRELIVQRLNALL